MAIGWQRGGNFNLLPAAWPKATLLAALCVASASSASS
jgi:hypothetical protein